MNDKVEWKRSEPCNPFTALCFFFLGWILCVRFLTITKHSRTLPHKHFGISTFPFILLAYEVKCFNPYRDFPLSCTTVTYWCDGPKLKWDIISFFIRRRCCCCLFFFSLELFLMCCWFASSWALLSSQLFLLSMLRKCFLNFIFN